MIEEFTIKTEQECMINITSTVVKSIMKSKIKNGICIVFCPHTTAGITINENVDKDVVHDILLGLRKAVPENQAFLHSEGNSTAHIKSSLMGSSVTLLVENSKPILGTWQGVFFCEFDGPRTRNFLVKTLSD